MMWVRDGAYSLYQLDEKMESVQDMSGCEVNQKVKHTAGLFVGKALTWWNSQIHTQSREVAVGMAGHAAYTDRFHELARLVPHLSQLLDVNPDECEKLSQLLVEHAYECGMSDDRYKSVVTRTLGKRKGIHVGSDGGVAGPRIIMTGNRASDLGMDWLFDHKAEIIYHEKVVRIPLLDGKVLRVLGEKPEEKMRQLMSAKAKEKKQEEIMDLGTGYHTAEECMRLYIFKRLQFRIVDGIFQVRKVQFLGYVINSEGIHVDPSKIEAVKSWETPRTPFEVCSFLGLAGYYRRFIENFSKIAKPLTVLTQKSKTCAWGKEQENAFQTLKDKLCNALVLALPDEPKDFVVYCDASGLGLGCVLMQRELFSEYDCEICYHSGKANVVADALSRKERVKPNRVRAMNMTFQSSIKNRILAAQKEAFDKSARL
ncbi:putative reverse transcriptase domain-containing protein [Tanacetum coccineum]